jgi:hypothetical protein
MTVTGPRHDPLIRRRSDQTPRYDVSCCYTLLFFYSWMLAPRKIVPLQVSICERPHRPGLWWLSFRASLWQVLKAQLRQFQPRLLPSVTVNDCAIAQLWLFPRIKQLNSQPQRTDSSLLVPRTPPNNRTSGRSCHPSRPPSRHRLLTISSSTHDPRRRLSTLGVCRECADVISASCFVLCELGVICSVIGLNKDDTRLLRISRMLVAPVTTTMLFLAGSIHYSTSRCGCHSAQSVPSLESSLYIVDLTD